ncbi:hypothetical protein DBV15_04709 [Temnothorax longispinosus]|uniref:Uncharacterized protein n=1 Tax=Temnothorax longispinosus TaxID=300112 RepID=A0A4S2K8M0_9HYME|nr:hypothetical protein DBV15_04709 [Temnothorax longispinosus]
MAYAFFCRGQACIRDENPPSHPILHRVPYAPQCASLRSARRGASRRGGDVANNRRIRAGERRRGRGNAFAAEEQGGRKKGERTGAKNAIDTRAIDGMRRRGERWKGTHLLAVAKLDVPLDNATVIHHCGGLAPSLITAFDRGATPPPFGPPLDLTCRTRERAVFGADTDTARATPRVLPHLLRGPSTNRTRAILTGFMRAAGITRRNPYCAPYGQPRATSILTIPDYSAPLPLPRAPEPLAPSATRERVTLARARVHGRPRGAAPCRARAKTRGKRARRVYGLRAESLARFSKRSRRKLAARARRGNMAAASRTSAARSGAAAGLVMIGDTAGAPAASLPVAPLRVPRCCSPRFVPHGPGCRHPRTIVRTNAEAPPRKHRRPDGPRNAAVHLCATTSLFANTATGPRNPFRLHMPVLPVRGPRGSFHCYYYYRHRHTRRSLASEGTAGTFTQSHTASVSVASRLPSVLVEEPRRWAAEVGGNSERREGKFLRNCFFSKPEWEESGYFRRSLSLWQVVAFQAALKSLEDPSARAFLEHAGSYTRHSITLPGGRCIWTVLGCLSLYLGNETEHTLHQ